MQEHEVYLQLTKIFRDILGDDSIALANATSSADLEGWDSFNHINIVLAAEAFFKVKFSSGELENMESVGDMVALIQQKLEMRA